MYDQISQTLSKKTNHLTCSFERDDYLLNDMLRLEKTHFL